MSGKYSVSNESGNISLVPVAGSGLPVIKIGSGLAALDVQKFVYHLNNKIEQSPAYGENLKWAGSEGIVVHGVTYNPKIDYSVRQVDQANKVDPRLVGGFAIYLGLDKGKGIFINDPDTQFELKAYLSLSSRIVNGELNYDALMDTLLHEGVSHPRHGKHIWEHYPGDYERVLKDPVYLADFKIQSELGYSVVIGSTTASALSAILENIRAGDFVLSFDGYKAMERRAGKSEKEIAALPEDIFSGSHSFKSDSGATVWVVSEQEYLKAVRYEEGRGLPIDLLRAERLYSLAAADSGGAMWVYVPSVGGANEGADDAGE